VTADPIVAERLADFVCAWRRTDPGEAPLHAAKRLILNQLKASAEASQQAAGQRLLAQAARAAGSAAPSARAHLWWSGLRARPEQARAFNAQLLGLLALGDTHLPTLSHFTAGLLPTLLAQAEAQAHSGERLLTALAVGLEVAIAGAMLATAPQHATAALSLGAAAARCTLLGLDRRATTTALAEVCASWTVSPGALHAAFDGLGLQWRFTDIAMHCRPLPVAALAPMEAVLMLRASAGPQSLQGMQLSLSPRAWSLVQGGMAGLREAMAAAWLLGQFTVDEQLPACRDHPSVQALSGRIELCRDERIQGLEACSLSAHFTDGSAACSEVDAFLGSPAQPLSDSQLSELFRSAADDLVLPRRSGEILHALWGLECAADVGQLLGLLCRPC
jgi:2-methylcitrate dehydratase PrpD